MKSLILLATIILLSFNQKQGETQKVYISSINWSIVFRVPLPAYGLWFKNGHPLISNCFRTEITDSVFHNKLNSKMSELLSKKTIYRDYDARISCIVYRDSNKSDTLTIHKNSIQLNSKYYEFDRSFVKLFYPYVEPEQQEILSEYFGF